MEAMSDAGIHVCESPAMLGDAMQRALAARSSRKAAVKKSVSVSSKKKSKPIKRSTPKKKPIQKTKKK
jgi:hypothetical protein